MADIELVIKIPEEDFEIMKHNIAVNNPLCPLRQEEVVAIIAHGIPLDLEGLKSDMKALNCGYPYGLDYLLDCLEKRLGLTIIEADTENEG